MYVYTHMCVCVCVRAYIYVELYICIYMHDRRLGATTGGKKGKGARTLRVIYVYLHVYTYIIINKCKIVYIYIHRLPSSSSNYGRHVGSWRARTTVSPTKLPTTAPSGRWLPCCQRFSPFFLFSSPPPFFAPFPPNKIANDRPFDKIANDRPFGRWLPWYQGFLSPSFNIFSFFPIETKSLYNIHSYEISNDHNPQQSVFIFSLFLFATK
jgi:hypothetical protein